jgi:hypothetical protein
LETRRVAQCNQPDRRAAARKGLEVEHRQGTGAE